MATQDAEDETLDDLFDAEDAPDANARQTVKVTDEKRAQHQVQDERKRAREQAEAETRAKRERAQLVYFVIAFLVIATFVGAVVLGGQHHDDHDKHKKADKHESAHNAQTGAQ